MIDQFRRRPAQTLGANVILALLWAFPLPAQQQPSAPVVSTQSAAAAPSAQAGQASSPAPAKTDAKSNDDPPPVQQNSPKNDRLLYTLPNYLTVENATHLPPLTVGEKFKLVAEGTFDPVEYPFVGVVALIGQGQNDEPSFGQGFRGYAKRYAVGYGDTAAGNFMSNALVPSLLHQDPRYYQLGTGGFFRRTAYALARIFVTRSDSGKREFNVSEIGGNALAGAISNLYHPREDRNLSNNVSVWWTQIAWDTVGFELKEFWPDLRRLIRKPQPATP
ncbi:MAG TPA: hypothetical protein VKM93_23040 [Terriglobia bacterium]|nr:hypothetical protein [Terriglobia bacterium]